MDERKNNLIQNATPIVHDITNICDECICESSCFDLFNFKCDNHKKIILEKNNDDEHIVVEKK